MPLHLDNLIGGIERRDIRAGIAQRDTEPLNSRRAGRHGRERKWPEHNALWHQFVGSHQSAVRIVLQKPRPIIRELAEKRLAAIGQRIGVIDIPDEDRAIAVPAPRAEYLFELLDVGAGLWRRQDARVLGVGDDQFARGGIALAGAVAFVDFAVSTLRGSDDAGHVGLRGWSSHDTHPIRKRNTKMTLDYRKTFCHVADRRRRHAERWMRQPRLL